MPCRRWPYILLALAVASVILTFPRVSRAQGCAPISAILEKAEADSRLVEIRVLQGKKLALAVALFNADDERDIPWGMAYLAVRADGWGILMVGFDLHVCYGMRLKPDEMRLFLKSMDGQAV